MNRNKLDKAIERILFEDMSFGLHSKVSTIHDRPITSGEPDVNFKPNMASTMQSSVPLRPSELMATQLADERPPIEDLEYAPVSVPALKAAVAAIADLVPPDQVTRFYRRAQELLDDAVERQAEGEIAKSAEVEEEMKNNSSEGKDMNKNESRRKRLNALIRVLKEAVGPTDAELSAIESGAAISNSAQSELSDEAVEEKLRSSPSAVTDDEILKGIADYLKFNSPSGAKQYMQRIFDRVKFTVSKVGAKKMETFKLSAATKYASSLLDTGDERLADMTPREIVKSDDVEFRFFLGNLIADAYDELKKKKFVNLKSAIAGITDIPPEIRDTVFNQVTGGSARKDSTIRSRLAGKYSEDAIERAVKSVSQSFSEFESILSNVTGDLVMIATGLLNDPKEMNRRIVAAQTEESEFNQDVIIDEVIGEKLLALKDNIVATLRASSSINVEDISQELSRIKEDEEFFNIMMTDPKYTKTKSLYDAITLALNTDNPKEILQSFGY